MYLLLYEIKDSFLTFFIKSTLCDKPVHFECFTGFTMSSSSLNIWQTLTLNIKTHGFEMIERCENIVLVYRICYKKMTTIVPNLRSIQRY
jgi:hypothetical protein